MKKKILYITALSVTLAACSKVFDVNPTASIASDVAISNKAGVEHALVGTYNALQSVGLYGRNYLIIGDLTSGNLTWTGTSQDYGQVEDIPIPADNSIVDGFWAAAYDGINRANNILDKLPSIGDMTQEEANQFEGEALFIRSLLYYDLVSYFGGVPLKLQPTSDLNNINAERNTALQVYDQIITDLATAKTKMAATKVTGRANSFAASALLAKVYLARYYISKDQSDATLAVTEATNVISLGGYTLSGQYAELFSTAISPESVFEVVYDLQNFNRLAQYYYPRSLIGRYEISPTTAFIQGFEASDQRLAASVAYDEKNLPYGIKYNDVAGGTDRVYVIRLAEMYLLRAEALVCSNGEIAAIQADIDMVRNRAGLANTTAANLDELKLAIENERNHEFAFEGHRWIDLVRTGRAPALLGIDPKYTLFPIPLSEMLTNSNMNQNPGY